MSSVKYHSWLFHETKNLDSLTYELLDIPQPQANQLLVKNECSVINASDLALLRGHYNQKKAPLLAGLKGSGTVVKVGTGAERFLNKKVAFAADGTWAEYTLVNLPTVYILDDSTSFEFATTICYNPLTVLNIIDYVQKGSHKALINNAAASALGKQLLKYSQKLGIKLINIVARADQLEILKKLGAEYVICSEEEGWKDRARELAAELGASVGFDCVGGTALDDMLSIVPNNSVIYIYGCLSGDTSQFHTDESIFRGKKIEGLYVIGWFHEKDEEEQMRLLSFLQENQDIFLTEFSREIKLCEVKEALLDYSRSSTNNKILIRTRVD